VAKYDVAIIGSGPGGYVAAIRAGELGLKTVVVEKDPFLGGTCLHVGCIPTKVLLHHAEIYDHFKEASEYGIEVSGLKLNWGSTLARKDKIVKKHAKGIEFLFKKNKVEWLQGWGRYEGPGKISVEKDGKKTTIEASNVLMVSGSEARALPGIEPDHKTILTNRSILELPEIPKTLIVVGAGAVGVEFASIYNSFGTQVTILEALPRAVPVEDEEISVELEKTFKKKNIVIQTSCKVDTVKKDAKGVTVSFTDKDGKAQTLQAEKLLLAVGRKPMTDGCGLEKSKAKLERGFVHAGPTMETAEKGLYAIGDIVAGLPVRKNDVILIAPWLLHRHEKLWRDPNAFIPQRFMPGAPPPDRFAYLPFGVGPRICIGAHFALVEATLALAKLVGAFRIELLDKEPVVPVGVVTTQPDHSPMFAVTSR